jgi:uncharacterized C2H2 Zn-finger protein
VTQVWSEEEIRALADSAYKRQALRCPRCSARVKSQEMGYLGRASTPLRLSCERCGATAKYSPDHLEEMKLQWTYRQKVRIVERYWAVGYAECPNDGAHLKVIKSQTIKPPPPQIFFTCPHCGRHFWSQEIDNAKEPASFEGNYEILHTLGEGGMGSVVLARHLQSGDLVAAKRIHPKFLGNAEIVKRFARESRILKGLDHPNVVRIRATYIDDSGGVIVMQYVEGGTLTEAINSKRPAGELLRWFSGVATGLAFLHGQGVVHRDLKPDNVLLDGPVARISDFGLARLLARDSTTLTMQGAFLGTRLYAAPEQLDNSVDVTTSCDLYALGLIAYEIATGRSPYRMPINTNKFSPALHEVLIKVLGDDPAERPTGETLVQALREQLGL